MSDEEKKDGEEGKTEEAPKKSKKKLFIIIGVVVLLLGAGIPVFLLGGKPAEEQAAVEEHAEEEEHTETVELDHFIVNLGENASFLKVKMMLEVSGKALHKVEEAAAGGEGGGGGHGGGASKSSLPGILGQREAMVRDTIIRILSSKRAEEVLSVDGKDQLKEELVDALNEAVNAEEPVVLAVYFADFIIQ